MSTHAPAHRPLAPAHHTHRSVPKLNDSFEQTKLHLKSASTHAAHAGSGSSILRTLVALVIVVAVIYGLTWIVKKLKRRESGGAASGDGMERISQLSLGSNRSVALVRVGSELHLLGVAEHSVTPIRSFSEDEAITLGLPVTPPGSVFSMRGGDPDAGGLLSGLRGNGGFAAPLDTLKRMTQR